MIETAFRTILTADHATAALVGARVTFVEADQNELRPRIVLQTISDGVGHTMEGANGVHNGRMQVSCLAPTYPAAKALAKAAVDAVDDYQGTVAGITDLSIDYIEAGDLSDVPGDVPAGAEKPTTFGVMFDALFQYQEI